MIPLSNNVKLDVCVAWSRPERSAVRERARGRERGQVRVALGAAGGDAGRRRGVPPGARRGACARSGLHYLSALAAPAASAGPACWSAGTGAVRKSLSYWV